MVLVVGDVEAYYLLEFLVFFFEEREHKTVELFLRVVHLELLPATEQQLTSFMFVPKAAIHKDAGKKAE